MVTKRILSCILCILMIATMAFVPASVSAATVDNVSGYNLPADVNDGNILHAFNWKLKEVTQYAQEIAEAGYTAVQVSPIQCTKDTTNDGAYANDWWCFYQPTDLAIGNELGNEADLREMCSTLDKYGVKVIVDVVANHVQNSTDKKEASNVNPTLKSFLRNPSGIKLVPYADGTRKGQTTTDLNSQLPDLDTSNKDYQNYLIKYLNTLTDCGVDGFRFDAAKHIETPEDGDVASDFWPTVTGAIKDKNSKAYIYGEILGLNGLLPITAYTKYMDVTDSAYGGVVRSALKAKKANTGLVNYGFTGSQKNNNVIWVESHDTFTTNPADTASSNKLTIAQQIVGWAVIGARKDAPALYLVRTNCSELDATPSLVSIKYDELIGAPGAADTWKNPVVKAVNQFKNEFVGQSETVTANGNFFFVQRGTTGMVIANLAATTGTVNQACTMANGTYIDQVTGNKFIVTGGKISGTVGESGVAVVYNAKKIAPTATVTLNSEVLGADTLTSYTTATANIGVKLNNATSGTVKVNGVSEVKFTGEKYIILGESVQTGKGVEVTVTATNGTQTTEATYIIKKKDINETKRVYFDNTVTQWPKVHVFCKTDLDRETKLHNFPGLAMTKDETNPNLYYCDVPAATNYVKFSEGYVSTHIGHSASVCGGYCGRTMPPTVIYFGTANSSANRESGGYKLTGSMIFEKLEFKDYGEYPVAALKASDLTYSDVKPADPKPVDPIIPGTLYLGDADLDGTVTVMDATEIQMAGASIITLSNEAKLCADVDNDGAVSVMDATAIQMHMAQVKVDENIGKPIGSQPDDPEPPVKVETKKVTLNATDAFKNGEVYLFAYNDEGSVNAEWPGEKMTSNGSGYTLDVDETLNKIKFVGVYGDVTKTIESNPYDLSETPYTLEAVKLTCTEKWTSAYIHVWNEDPANNVSTTWPGIKMSGKSGAFEFYVPKNSAYTAYKFNNNAGKESNTYYLVEPETTSVYFTDVYGWNNVYIHCWKTGGGSTAWPGLQMEYVETNAQNQKVYKIDLPIGAYNTAIFNNKGGGKQTVNVPVNLTRVTIHYPTPVRISLLVNIFTVANL